MPYPSKYAPRRSAIKKIINNNLHDHDSRVRVQCSYCGSKILESSETCPRCGGENYPEKRRYDYPSRVSYKKMSKLKELLWKMRLLE